MATALRIKLKPKARSSSLEESADGTWVARVESPPVDGKSNRELVALVAERFGCAKSDVQIKAGASGPMKLVQVETD